MEFGCLVEPDWQEHFGDVFAVHWGTPYKRALFGQDKWDAAGSVAEGERDRVLAVGESAKFGADYRDDQGAWCATADLGAKASSPA